MDVQANNEIVMPRLRRPGREIALDPLDALCDIGPGNLGHRPPVSQCRCREVYRRDLPAMRGEPKRVCAMSTASVEGTSRRKVGSLCHQMCVGWMARDFVGVLAQRLRPQLLPEVVIEFGLGFIALLAAARAQPCCPLDPLALMKMPPMPVTLRIQTSDVG